MAWWYWLLAAIAMLGWELFTPGGFYVMFFGVGALVVGVLVALGAGGPPWVQWLVFSAVSVASLTEALVVVVILALLVIVVIAKSAVVVPQQNAFVIERLGKYRGTLPAGFHVLFPFIDIIRYRHSLKKTAVDIPEQVCITRDNVQVHGLGAVGDQGLAVRDQEHQPAHRRAGGDGEADAGGAGEAGRHPRLRG